MLRAAEVGEELVNEMYYMYQDVRGDQKNRDIKAKYVTVMSVLITQPSYKKRLIDGEVGAKAFVSMKKEDFISEEEKRKKEDAAAAKM